MKYAMVMIFDDAALADEYLDQTKSLTDLMDGMDAKRLTNDLIDTDLPDGVRVYGCKADFADAVDKLFAGI